MRWEQLEAALHQQLRDETLFAQAKEGALDYLQHLDKGRVYPDEAALQDAALKALGDLL